MNSLPIDGGHSRFHSEGHFTLRIPHGGFPKMQNIGNLISIGRHTVLHLGDAHLELATYAPYAEALKSAIFE